MVPTAAKKRKEQKFSMMSDVGGCYSITCARFSYDYTSLCYHMYYSINYSVG